MGFYIEELPTELNGITMQEADYLADEFLKDTPCNRMWDAMRALRDFYETVTSEAVEIADRKTENSSEKPNNCDDCIWSVCNYNKAFEDEPTISKMEQVDKDINVRSKDERQWTKENCKGCKYNEYPYDSGTCFVRVCINGNKYEPKDEPQIQLTARCLNCNNAKACKEKHWEECVYEPKDEKTCETCRHWKYIAHEWQCEACKCQGYEPKDEPQAERSE